MREKFQHINRMGNDKHILSCFFHHNSRRLKLVCKNMTYINALTLKHLKIFMKCNIKSSCSYERISLLMKKMLKCLINWVILKNRRKSVKVMQMIKFIWLNWVATTNNCQLIFDDTIWWNKYLKLIVKCKQYLIKKICSTPFYSKTMVAMMCHIIFIGVLGEFSFLTESFRISCGKASNSEHVFLVTIFFLSFLRICS